MAQSFEWINFILWILGMIGWSYFYLISIQPMKMANKIGEKAWLKCKRFRMASMIPMGVATISYIVWYFYPIQEMDWKISNDPIIGWIVAIVLSLIFLPFMFLGEKAAGKESLVPSKETKMYGGIYKYIRHPQTLGEFPLFIAFGFAANSWLLVILSFLYVVIYTPIMVYFEDEDLSKRFGTSYDEYRKNTGGLFPKFKKIKKHQI